MQLSLLHLPGGRLPRPHELLLLLQELPVEQRDLLLVRVAQPAQGCLVRVVQLGEEVLLLESEEKTE